VMNCKGCGRKQPLLSLRRYTKICLEGQTETTRNVNKDSWTTPGIESNFRPPEYEVAVLQTHSDDLWRETAWSVGR
jgi:hypothetical protein